MKIHRRLSGSGIFLAMALGAAAVSRGAISLATDQLNDGSIFIVSDADLLQTNLGSISATGSFGGFANNAPSLLANGTFVGANTDGGQSVAPGGGAQVVFALDLAASPAGYRITGIDTYAGWDFGRDGQE